MQDNKKQYVLNKAPVGRADAVVAGKSYRFTVLTDRLIRLEYQLDGIFVDEPTQKVICRDFPACDYRMADTENSLEIITEHLHLYYDKKPFSPEGLSIQLKESYHVYGSVWNYGDEIHDLKGTARTLDNADGAVELESGLLSREGFTVLDDSNSAVMTEEEWIAPKKAVSLDLYFFGYGHDYLGCLKDFYHLCGQVPLLPRYTMGNWWSRFYRYTEKSYLELMNRFRENDIPFSTAVIDMDWHLTEIPEKYGSGWTGYTWNPELFPDPERFLDKLHEMGLRVTLNVHPADGVRAHEEAYLTMARQLNVNYEKEDKIPFNVTDRRFMESYFTCLHHPHEEKGVDFWWIDWQQGSRSKIPGIDPLWMLNHLHFLDSGREGRTPLILSRYAGVGSHRYPLGFSGDTYSTWESLDFQPYFTATASNVGYSWWSHDIGGHQGGRHDDELATRWTQFGVFSPIMRLHSTSNTFSGKEPWNYGTAAEQTMVSFLRLRHELVPYLYSMNYRTHRMGEPLMQPMYYRHDVPEAYNVPNEYWFGTEMIVCPITKPVSRETLLAEFAAWLPEGEFFDLFTGQLYKGGRRLKLYRDLKSIPVLVKVGGILPLAGDHASDCSENPKELKLQVFNGADGAFDLYEDAGTGREAESVITHIKYKSGKETELSIDLEGKMEGVIPEGRIYDVRIQGVEEPTSVMLETGTEIMRSYDAERHEFRLRLDSNGLRSIKLRLHLENSHAIGRDKKTAIYGMLQGTQISYDLKSDIFTEVCREQDLIRLTVKLKQMKMSPDLEEAVIEQLVSDC